MLKGMQKVTKVQTSDGKLFDDTNQGRQDAIAHQVKLDREKRLDDFLKSSHLTEAERESIGDFLKENAEQISNILNS